MEEIKLENELRLYVAKKENLRKKMEKITSTASDVLILNLQWCDLEDHLDSSREMVEKRYREVVSKEGELQKRSLALEERVKAVEAAEAEMLDLEMKTIFFRSEVEEKGEELGLLRKSLEYKTGQLNELLELLRKTRVDFDLKGEQLSQIETDLERCYVKLNTEKEQLGRIGNDRRKLEADIERKSKNLTLVVDKITESQKLLETQSSELIKIQTEVELKGKELDSVREHLDKCQTCSRELEEEIEKKRKDLTKILDQIADRGKHLELSENQLASQQKQLEILSLELVSKKEELDRLNLDLDLANSLDNELKETSQQIKSKEKKLKEIERLIQERTGRNESIEMLLKEHSEELASKEKRQNEITEAIHTLSLEIVSKEATIQQLLEKQHSKQKNFDSIDAEFVLKEKELCSVKDTYRECLQNREIKEKELKLLEEEVKKIQESLKDFQSKEVEQVRLKALLMEREKELGMKEMQFRAHSENIELKEKKLDSREERLNKKDEQLKSAEQKMAKCVKDYELKTKKLASFCQQNKPDQQVDLAQNASVRDEKTLQLLLHGHLKKYHTLHLDVLSALKASSDPGKLVLVIIQGLHERMVVAELEPDNVNRSSICLLECLMNISPEPKNDLLGEAIKSAAEWKRKTLVKADNPMEALGFLHFLAAFSLAYTFDADKVHSLFDTAFLRQYLPSIFNNVLSSLDGNPEQQPSEAPIRNSSDSCSPDFQENIASSHLGNEDALLEPEGSAFFSPNEIVAGFQNMKDPAGCVLNLVNDELMNAQRRGESSLSEPIVKNLVSLLEELPRFVGSSEHLLSDASQVAQRWSRMLGNSSQMSPLEAWGFLQLLVAYGLVHRTNRDNTLRFALSVAHFKRAPKLFESLGLGYAIKDLVRQLLEERHYLLAIRFILYFNMYNFPSLEVLKDQIVNLRSSVKDKRRFDSQAEDRDAAKLKDIIELIDEFKLEIDIPVDLIIKFMVPREIQNQNPYLVSSIVPVQQTFPTILGGSPTQQVLQLETYQAGGSTIVHGQSSSHQAGHKRPRVDPSVSGHVIRPCFNQSSYDRV